MDDWETRYIVRLHRRGWSLRRISRKIGRSHEWVRQHLIVALRSRPKLGRPPKYGERMLSLRVNMTPSIIQALDMVARQKNISRNDVVIQVLMRWAKRNGYL